MGDTVVTVLHHTLLYTTVYTVYLVYRVDSGVQMFMAC